MATPSDLLQQYQQLDQDQQQQFLGYLKAGAQFGSNSVTVPVREDPDVSQCLRVTMTTLQELGVPMAWEGLARKMGGARLIKDKVPGVMQFVRLGGKRRDQSRALLRLGVVLLYTELVQRGDIVTPITILRQFHRIPACIEAGFPGYAKAGLLQLLVRQAQPKVPKNDTAHQ